MIITRIISIKSKPVMLGGEGGYRVSQVGQWLVVVVMVLVLVLRVVFAQRTPDWHHRQ